MVDKLGRNAPSSSRCQRIINKFLSRCLLLARWRRGVRANKLLAITSLVLLSKLLIMKKFALVLSIVAVFALVNVASAATVDELLAQIATLTAQVKALQGGSATVSSSVPTITKTLTLGSRGEEVEALQQYLIDEGLLDWDGALGYFGNLTKKAVIEWQKANDVSPASGLFGPLSRAALAALAEAAPVVTPGTPGSTGTVFTPDQSDGSVTVSLSPAVSLSQTLKKGDVDKGVYAVRLQATGGKVNVNRLDVHFTERPWLDFVKLTLKDQTGAVLATKTLTSASDVTEVTIGADYLVRFENMSYVVTPGTDATLTVFVDVLAASDKITGQTVGIAIPTGAIRTINGRGYTDSTGLTVGTFSAGQTNVNSVTLSSTGSAADIIPTLSQNSPLAGPKTISTTVTTSNVELADFRLRSQNQSSTVNGLVVNITTDPNYGAVSSYISNVRIVDGATSYGAASFTGNGTGVATFTNLNIPLSQDVNKELKVLVDVAATGTNFAASTTLDASGITAVDANYNAATISGVARASATADVVSNNITLTANALSVSGPSAAAGTGIIDVASGPVVKYPVHYTFTLNNASVNNLWISGDTS
ncbi:MAG: peptidoglycan-binding protein, partial [Candidatus Paceibacterota bacterium]